MFVTPANWGAILLIFNLDEFSFVCRRITLDIPSLSSQSQHAKNTWSTVLVYTKLNYYSFKVIILFFWLAKILWIIHHNQLLSTKNDIKSAAKLREEKCDITLPLWQHFWITTTFGDWVWATRTAKKQLVYISKTTTTGASHIFVDFLAVVASLRHETS